MERQTVSSSCSLDLRKLLVVVNPSLMDNHQLELAEAMSRRSFCVGWPEVLLRAF